MKVIITKLEDFLEELTASAEDPNRQVDGAIVRLAKVWNPVHGGLPGSYHISVRASYSVHETPIQGEFYVGKYLEGTEEEATIHEKAAAIGVTIGDTLRELNLTARGGKVV